MAGTQDASVAQFPAKMGELGVDTVYKAVIGETVEPNVDTGTAIVTNGQRRGLPVDAIRTSGVPLVLLRAPRSRPSPSWRSTVPVTITAVDLVRHPVPDSRDLDGSDAMNEAPDYSAAYVILRTDDPDGREGHGLTFTTGRGNELCVAAIDALGCRLVGRTLDSPDRRSRRASTWSSCRDGQLRWVGPEKGVIHLATAAVVNAVWDLYAKLEGKPLWKLSRRHDARRSSSRCVPFRYITDALTPAEALDILRRQEPSKAAREAEILATGYPAYTTSIGWLGYPDDKVRRLCREGVAAGWRHFKLKVGRDLDEDVVGARDRARGDRPRRGS